ncbi:MULTISPECIES: helix-turn-helix domain-containing protein [Paenibacillus]|nr:hypothetical protein BK132_10830 [Paenibacillus sp. FSL H8-0259]
MVKVLTKALHIHTNTLMYRLNRITVHPFISIF